jgi:glutamate N-acetyltransferase/amino-acid N-acetyltransferase
MTDAMLKPESVQIIFERVADRTYNRLDSDGCTSTNDTVLLLGSGASGLVILDEHLEELLMEVCGDLAVQLLSDAEGHTKVVSIKVIGAASEVDAVEVGRSCARNNLLKCALFGGDPNWGRILAAVGTSKALFDGSNVDVWLNGIHVARSSAPGADRNLVNLAPKQIEIVIDLKVGNFSATILTNDLSHDYVHENSAYSS